MSTPDPSPAFQQAQRQLYWQRICRLTAGLLALWFLLSFVLIYFARSLSFTFFGWPFSFWLASQGALIVFVLIVVAYTWAANRLDEAYRREAELD